MVVADSSGYPNCEWLVGWDSRGMHSHPRREGGLGFTQRRCTLIPSKGVQPIRPSLPGPFAGLLLVMPSGRLRVQRSPMPPRSVAGSPSWAGRPRGGRSVAEGGDDSRAGDRTPRGLVRIFAAPLRSSPVGQDGGWRGRSCHPAQGGLANVQCRQRLQLQSRRLWGA